MRLLARIGLGAGALAAVLAVALVAGGAFYKPPAADRDALLGKAEQYDARIERDDYGVPHIIGAKDADVAFGLGFAHAEDDFATIQKAVFTARGTLAAMEGPKAAPADYLVRAMRVWPIVEAHYEALPADLRAVMEAYADGVNYYAALHPEKSAAGLLPITGKDVEAGFVFKTPFFYGFDETLGKLLKPTKGAPMEPIGSNGVAVAPSRSSDGATRLLVNSHQPYEGLVAWYEAELESGEGWHVAGGFFPGSPFMLHGHNAHLGWANTVNKPDLIDIYRLEINPADKDEYKFDGAWKRFAKSDAAIRVKLLGPISWVFHKPLLWSVHGPVFKTDHGVFAVRYAGIGEYRQPLQYYRLDKAQNLGEWRAAMALQALPSINYIYADERGNIGYVYNGQFPARIAGVNWQDVLPGDRGDLVWRTYLPFAQVPQIWNPKSGYVFNSNNTPFQATGPQDALKPAAFPTTMGLQTNMTNRAWRAQETFGADEQISAEAFRAYKFDLSYSVNSDMAKMIAAVDRLDPGANIELRAAQDVLRHWDLQTDLHNHAAALAVLTLEFSTQPGPKGEAPLPLADALKKAAKLLTETYHRTTPEWGDVNRIRRGRVDLPIAGGPDIYRAVYGELQPDGRLKAFAGDTLIMFVTWDKTGKLSSESIHQFGSATMDEKSKHYADQTPLFAAMKTKPVLFTPEERKGHIEEAYKPGDREKAIH